ncbi:MAG TPA: diadenylate cyclase CdaA [Haliangiales bacterium]|nr:diadenylate cyclase CdaA [Haliangiales bacterium]
MTVLEILQNIWRPTLEITILAVAIYYVLTFVRGTRAWPIVLGFVLCMLVLTVVGKALDLRVLLWLLEKFLTGVAIAVLVIFQPELRRLLAKLGNLPLSATSLDARENIEVIIETAERLSEAKIGALIALEQTIHLDEVVESGVAVDCEATPEMLETIFFPNNAIHDGGVIIRGDRIARAACIFPLTRRQDLNPSLGTRHRAAIGLAEETDAVVIAVSEETGAISSAYRGQLTRGVSLEELRAFLTSVLVRVSKPHRLTEWFRSSGFARLNGAPKPVIEAAPKPEAK